MSGAVLLSQLMLSPVLIILGWLYVRTRPRNCAAGGAVAVFDAVVLTAAVLGSLVAVLWVGNADVGDGNRIWRPILSIITTFHIFPPVLLVGWWLRRRMFGR